MTRLRATFDGKVLVPTEPVDLPQGRILDVEVAEADAGATSVDALLRAVREPPHVDRETVDELERVIETGKRPVRFNSAFDNGK
jgi:hypothetical protein